MICTVVRFQCFWLVLLLYYDVSWVLKFFLGSVKDNSDVALSPKYDHEYDRNHQNDQEHVPVEQIIFHRKA